MVAVISVDAYVFLAFSDLTCPDLKDTCPDLKDTGICVFWLQCTV